MNFSQLKQNRSMPDKMCSERERSAASERGPGGGGCVREAFWRCERAGWQLDQRPPLGNTLTQRVLIGVQAGALKKRPHKGP